MLIPAKSRYVLIFLLLLLLLISCGGEIRPARMSSTPVSIRGWIVEISPSGSSPAQASEEIVAAMKVAMFRVTSVSVEGIEFASGGVLDSGAFIVLDVPPGDSTIIFAAPGIGVARLDLRKIPPNADVLIPAIALRGDKVVLLRPDQVMIRVPSDSKGPGRRLPMTAAVGSAMRDVYEVPLKELTDRRDYPEPPPGLHVVPLR